MPESRVRKNLGPRQAATHTTSTPTLSDLIGQALHTLEELAAAARTHRAPSMPTPTTWPTGVTTRFITRMGLLTRNPDIAVNLGTYDDKNPHDIPPAVCQGCGWQGHHGIGLRHQLLEAAQAHADNCTALPNRAA